MNWKGGLAEGQIEQALSAALVEIGQQIEGEAKKVLKPSAHTTVNGRRVWIRGGGKGVRTATLQRSIHAESPDYLYRNDNVVPSSSTPERGGGAPRPKRSGNRLIITVGSGMEYAMIMHFRYQFLTKGFNRVSPKALAIVRKHINKYKA